MREAAYAMMAAVFATMSLALLSGWFGRRSLAIAILIICLVLSIYQFLFEIYSPETGFRMPWIQTQLHDPPVNGSGAGS
jgi:fatty acid desaturase